MSADCPAHVSLHTPSPVCEPASQCPRRCVPAFCAEAQCCLGQRHLCVPAPACGDPCARVRWGAASAAGSPAALSRVLDALAEHTRNRLQEKGSYCRHTAVFLKEVVGTLKNSQS